MVTWFMFAHNHKLHSTTEYFNEVCRVICMWPYMTHMWSRANCAQMKNDPIFQDQIFRYTVSDFENVNDA